MQRKEDKKGNGCDRKLSKLPVVFNNFLQRKIHIFYKSHNFPQPSTSKSIIDKNDLDFNIL